MTKNSRLVYSTDKGRVKPESKTEEAKAHTADGIVRLFRETKGRKGKGVTIIRGLGLDKQALVALAKKLKQLCGTGGTVKDFDIEIQGEQRDKIREYLEKEGFKVKISGG